MQKRGFLLALASVIFVAFAPAGAGAQAFTPKDVEAQSTEAGDPVANSPEGLVRMLNDALLGAMQSADTLGFEGRYHALLPVVERVFDIRTMAGLSLGRSAWRQLDKEQRDAYEAEFAKFMTANYAAQFDGYSGEAFEIVGKRDGPQEMLLVDTRILRIGDDPVEINYLMRERRDRWGVIDIYLDGSVSELARRRSEFAGILRNQGFNALMDSLQATSVRLAREHSR